MKRIILNHIQQVRCESATCPFDGEIYHSGYLIGWDNLGHAWKVDCPAWQEDERANGWRRAPHFDMPAIDEITHKEPQS